MNSRGITQSESFRNLTSVSAIAVPALGLTVIAEFDVLLADETKISIAVADQNLDSLVVEIQMAGDSEWFEIAGQSADYTTPQGMLLGCSDGSGTGNNGDLTTIAAGDTGLLLLTNLAGVSRIRLRASAAADSASVTTKAGGA